MAKMIVLVALATLVLGPPPTQVTQPAGLAGTWEGSGTLTNTWTSDDNPQLRLKCEYVGRLDPPSITLSISPTGDAGPLTLAIPASTPACPVLRRTYLVRARVDGTRVTIDDPAGHRWDLALTKDLLAGTVTWAPPGPDPREALAVGFTYAPPLRPWDTPLTRLSGKVTLGRARHASVLAD